MTETPPAPTSRPRTRDWIAVDQLVTRYLNNASDDFERDVIRLAAELCGGPDPEVAGGGQVWKDALVSARDNLQTALVADLDAHQPADPADRPGLHAAVTDLLTPVDLADPDRETLTLAVTDLLTEHVHRARLDERQVIADWLTTRAERMGHGGSVIVEEQARALGSAAALLRAPDLET